MVRFAPEEIFHVETNRQAFERSPRPGVLVAQPYDLLTLMIRDGDIVETIYHPLETDLVEIFSKYGLNLARFYEIVRDLEPTTHTILIDAETYRKAG